MQRLSSRMTGTLLCVGIGVAAAALLGLSTTAVPAPPRWRGTLIGIAAGLYGVFFFELGYLRGRRRQGLSVPLGTDREQSASTPDEAKFWLKKFLEEQQKK